MPDDFHFVCVVTLGHPAPNPRWGAASSRLTQARKPLDDVVRWERWR